MNRIKYFSSGDKNIMYKTMGKRNECKTSKLGVGSASEKSDNQTNINETCRRSRRKQSKLVQP